MIKVGFIGNGKLSSTLVEKFLASGKLSSSEIIVSGRENGPEPAGVGWDRINAASDNSGVVKAAKYVFLCTGPSETENILKEIKDCVSEDTNLISTAHPASIGCMENAEDCKVTRLAPTMMWENGKRVSVICHNRKVEDHEAEYIESLLCEACNARVYKSKRF